MRGNQMVFKRNILVVTASILLVVLLVSGCMNTAGTGLSSSAKPDPETGLDNWKNAINNKDIDRLYNLAPQTVRSQISKTDFIQVNKDNPLFVPGISVTGYKIYNKSVNGNSARIVAAMYVTYYNITTQNSTVTPVYYTFNEDFEANEWKVWT